MKKILLSLGVVVLTFLSNKTQAQTNCAGNRYAQPIFTEVDSTVGIKYGQNFGQDGVTNVDLIMDVYYPKNDNDNSRPLVLLAHGGSFIGGSRKDLRAMSISLASMGYVVSSIDYRLLTDMGAILGDIPKGFKEEVVRAIHDMKAAVRYMRMKASDYGINPAVVIVGGMSAGAIMADHLTYMDSQAKIPADLVTYFQQQGGLEGNSGNPGYSSVPQMNLSMCGAIMDTTFVETGDQPFYGVHALDDNVVPPLFGQPNPGIPVAVDLYGDSLIFMRAQHQGVVSKYRNYATGGHCGFMTDPAFFADMTDFMHEQVCIQKLAIKDNATEIMFSVYPNPTNGDLTVDIPGNQWNSDLKIYDVTGKVVYSTTIQMSHNVTNINVDNLNAGIYQVRITTNDGRTDIKKFVKE